MLCNSHVSEHEQEEKRIAVVPAIYALWFMASYSIPLITHLLVVAPLLCDWPGVSPRKTCMKPVSAHLAQQLCHQLVAGLTLNLGPLSAENMKC